MFFLFVFIHIYVCLGTGHYTWRIEFRELYHAPELDIYESVTGSTSPMLLGVRGVKQAF